MQLVKPAHNLIKVLHRIDIGALCHCLREWAHLEVEARYDAKEARTRATSSPQQLRILRFVRSDQLASGGHDIDGLDSFAGPAPSPAIPTHAALQQEAAESHSGAMAAGEHQSMFSQELV